MKNKIYAVVSVLVLITIIAVGLASIKVEASDGVESYGATKALEQDSFSLEEMLNYAIQDEYLAKAEYDLIMKEYGVQRPFANIMKAEEYHVSMLLPLFEKYGYKVPADNTKDLVVLPESLESAYEIGVKAEIDNIEMYDKFLKSELEEDVRFVFGRLKHASENHLRAFENNSSKTGNMGAKRQGGGLNRKGTRYNSRKRYCLSESI